MRILVVEDEVYVAELIQTVLEDLGNSCVVVHSADEADQALERETVEFATLDVGLPGRSGLDWLESIARTRPELARKTLIITGMHLDSDQVRRVALCGAGVLAKPFTVDGLRDAVAALKGDPIPASGD
jgi:DNA-binding response OmpR family regulator